MTRWTALLACLLLVAPAAAATRYAAPTGAAEGPCTPAAPCTPAQAIAGSAPGDTVVLAPGTYDVPALVVPHALRITAPPDRPRPVLRSGAGVGLTVAPEAGGTVVEHLALRARGDGAVGVQLDGATVLDGVRVTSAGAPCLRSDAAGVRIEDSAFTLTRRATDPCLQTTGSDTTWEHVTVTALNGEVAAAFAGNGTLQDVTATGRLTGLVASGSPEIHRVTAAAAERGLVLEAGDSLVTDSVAVARQGGTALLGRGGSHNLVNLTVWGRGRGSAGLRAVNGAQLDVRNTIARGAAVDVAAEPATTGIDEDCDAFAGCPAGTVLIAHSNFRTARGVTDRGANQSGAVRVADAAFEDFRLLRRSPAIDAGSFEVNAASADRAGRFRWLGDSPDLGAYEYAPPRRLRPRRDRRPPVLRALALSTTRLRPDRRGIAFSAARRRGQGGGALLRWFVSERADVVLTLRRPGRSTPVVGTIVQPADLGWGSLRIDGRIDGRRLPRGRYVLAVLARDVTQNLSAPRRFSVVVR